MPDLDYCLYDTIPFSNAATDQLAFQVAQGADNTHTEQFCNSFFAGALPAGVGFDINRIVIFPDYAVPEGDIGKIWQASFVEIKVNDQTLFKAPMALCAGSAAFGGADATTAAASQNHVGLMGNGYTFDHPIVLPSGIPFKVRLVQTIALAAANSYIKVVLDGILHKPQT